jgi:hypothetical protein
MDDQPSITPAPPVKARDHQSHQEMLQSHKDAKQARRERHKRTHGRGYVYPGFF